MKTLKIALLASALISGPLLAQTTSPRQASPAAAPRSSAQPDTLVDSFRSPPSAARPRVWWHWMNGNISKSGIAADLAWMKRVGIGGLQNFDVDLSTSQIVDKRLAYMTPEWKDAFRFAAEEADRHGLELAIASSPGWSETGGPWVQPEDGIKKLVWSETIVNGGERLRIRLAQPPSVAGPFQDLQMQPEVSDLIAMRDPEQGPAFYRDVRVIAVPTAVPSKMPIPVLSDAKGKVIPADARSGVRGVTLSSIFAPEPPELRLDYGRPVTVRALTLHIPGGAIPLLGPLLAPALQSSNDGSNWNDVVAVRLEETPTTLAIPATTARYFRILVKPKMGGAPDPAAEEAKRNLAMDDVFGRGIGHLLGQPIKIGLFQLYSETKLDRFELKAGFAILDDYSILPKVDDGATGPAAKSTLDLTSYLQADGTLNWKAPLGTWKVIRLGYSLRGKTNHPAPKEATGLEVDKYDGDAVRRYLDQYIGNYRDAVGENLVGARGVRALLTDSIEIGAANWTPRFIEQFTRLRGYDPTPWLPTVTGTVIAGRDASDKFLFDYRRTLSDLMASEHYGTVAEVAHRNGLKVYGEAIEGNRSSFGDDMAMRRFADYPMAAMWTFDRLKGPQPSYVVDIKGAASVAHLYGQNIVAAESMTANMAPWAFGPADLRHIVDLEFVLGINRPVVHTSVHVPVEDRKPGLSLGGIGQFFNRNESWAELATPWIDYLSRNALMLQQGRNVADIAFFYGEEAPLSGLYGKKGMPEIPRGFGFDFLNFDALFSAISNDGNDIISSGGARYKAIYLGGSSTQMTLPALRRIAELVRGGATVIGDAPGGSPGLQSNADEYHQLVRELWSPSSAAGIGKGRVIATSDLSAGLQQLGLVRDFSYRSSSPDSDIPFAHRQLPDGDSYFLVNRMNREDVIEARFRVKGKVPELWHAETGETVSVSYRIDGDQTIVPLTLKAGGSIHVVFRKQAAQHEMVVPPRHVVAAVPLKSSWQVRFEAGRGAPEVISMPVLAPLDTHVDPEVRHFSGIATYETRFETPSSWQPGKPLVLNLGEAREVAEVLINGVRAGYAWTAPYTIDISRFVKRHGRNVLQVRVANLWVNRLIRDADPTVTTKQSWTSVATYKPTAPLRRSGLIGPVRLEVRD